MNTISNVLFWISNGLLVPVIVMLLLLFIRAIFLIGSFYGQYMSKKKADKQYNKMLDELTPETCSAFAASLPERGNSLFVEHLKLLFASKDSWAHCERHLANFEIAADKDLSNAKTLTKLGPMLGLMGTLIPMGPALVGLSTGDIGSMAYNMQVAFATTVVGLVAGGIGLIVQQVKQRWYLQDLTNLELVAKMLKPNAQ